MKTCELSKFNHVKHTQNFFCEMASSLVYVKLMSLAQNMQDFPREAQQKAQNKNGFHI